MKKLLSLMVLLGVVVLSGCSLSNIKEQLQGLVDNVVEKDQAHEQGFEVTKELVYESYSTEYRIIDLKGMGLTDIPDFCSLLEPKDFDEVWMIDLSNNNIKIVNADLSCLTYLKTLDLSYNNIEVVQKLGDLPALKQLMLHKNELSSTAQFPDLPVLETLNLAYNNLKDTAGLEDLGSLTNLQLQHNALESIVGVENLQNLETLKVEFNKLKDIDLEGINEKLEKLQVITAKGNEIKDSLMEIFDTINSQFVAENSPEDTTAEEE